MARYSGPVCGALQPSIRVLCVVVGFSRSDDGPNHAPTAGFLVGAVNVFETFPLFLHISLQQLLYSCTCCRYGARIEYRIRHLFCNFNALCMCISEPGYYAVLVVLNPMAAASAFAALLGGALVTVTGGCC